MRHLLRLFKPCVNTIIQAARLAVLFVMASVANLAAQNFVRITDPNNPIATDAGSNGYIGASWVDFDNDGDLDLFVNRGFLYRNEGSGNFTRVANHGIGAGLAQGTGSGVSWADYDNDGDLDCYFSGGQSVLYRNEGAGVFRPVTNGEIGQFTDNRGWACAWADFDNDGYVDLAITHPANFVIGGPTPNHLFHNEGAGRFTKILSGDVVTGLAPYTVGIWSDYDDDGDQDLFIGAGPALGTVGPDFLYQNEWAETGTANLKRITTGIIATGQRDGQNFNWIDYDNDGDLDAYVTNYAGNTGSGLANELFRRDGTGFTKITTGAIVTDVDISLGNLWADFDNDGDLDCFITNESGFNNRYYRNNGDGSFTRLDALAIVAKPNLQANHSGASAGDYDDDGDLDLFIAGPGANQSLFRNDLTGGNHWLSLRCAGTISNRAAIGTKVRAKATINGTAVWQRREISSQNAFNSHNSLRVHFGLGDAARVDSLLIAWPSGNVEIMTNVAVDQFLTITEKLPAGALRVDFDADPVEGSPPLHVSFRDLSIAEVNSPIQTWAWDFNGDGVTDSQEKNPEWTFTKPGLHTITLTASNGISPASVTRENFIKVLQFSKLQTSVVVSEGGASQGAGWIDFDNDNDLDLFVTNAQNQNNFLYTNDGAGNFARAAAGPISADGGNSQAASWGDFDGDGDLDVYVVNVAQKNFLYENLGNGAFAKVDSGEIANDSEASFGCSWADFDRDGDLDMFVANLNRNNSLYVNEGGGEFRKLTEGIIVNERAFAQNCSWSDYDNDGDIDLFVANIRSENDFLYANNGDGTFTKITDGEVVNDGANSVSGSWGDYDNDGAPDLFVANSATTGNFLYTNNGDGTFTRVIEGPVFTDRGSAQGSSWGDFDNDGDLDLYVAVAGQRSFLYANNGEGAFTRVDDSPFVSDVSTTRGAIWGDYDNDGDLDLYVAVAGGNNILYVNSGLGNHWIKFSLKGQAPNTSAIGAKVRIKAVINSRAVWQLRELSAQTGFCSQNDLSVHFGLGDATRIDSLKVEWPSGRIEFLTNLTVDRSMTLEEGKITAVDDKRVLPLQFALSQNHPNPFNPSTIIHYSLPEATPVVLRIYDALGREIKTLIETVQPAGRHAVAWNGEDHRGRIVPSGVYLYRLEAEGFTQTRKLLLLK